MWRRRMEVWALCFFFFSSRCSPEAARGGGASPGVHDRRVGSGVWALGPSLRDARCHARLHAAVHPGESSWTLRPWAEPDCVHVWVWSRFNARSPPLLWSRRRHPSGSALAVLGASYAACCSALWAPSCLAGMSTRRPSSSPSFPSGERRPILSHDDVISWRCGLNDFALFLFPQHPGGGEQRGCWDLPDPDHHRSLLPVPAALHARR